MGKTGPIDLAEKVCLGCDGTALTSRLRPPESLAWVQSDRPLLLPQQKALLNRGLQSHQSRFGMLDQYFASLCVIVHADFLWTVRGLRHKDFGC